MSDAQYLLLPFLRRGVATALSTPQDAGGVGARATIDVTLAFNEATADDKATATVSLYGPGDVTGFDSRAVIRTSPAANDYDAEANYFPLVEFDQPDLPWRLTPAAATASDRLSPWIVLVTLADGEAVDRRSAGSDRPFDAIQVADTSVLPALDQSWAWAHAQVTGLSENDADAVWDVIEAAPERATARLLSPRRLQANTAYTAYIVPAFERGRQRGLGDEPDTTVDGLTPAWSDSDTGVWLPVYYSWRFQTGQAGDFEYLVRRLSPVTLPDDVGARALDVSDPGLGLEPASASSLMLDGALRSAAAVANTWDASERAVFVADLASLLNAPADLLADGSGPRTVAPPLYGRWHALEDRVDEATSTPWFAALNLKPTRRVAAGLGTRVVQADQSAMLASAWSQVSRIRGLIEEMRLAQLAREAAQGLHVRQVTVLATQQVMLLTAPVATRLTTSPTTIASAIRRSPLPSAITSAVFRRVARRRSPLARRLGRAPMGGTLLDRANRGAITPQPKPAPGRLCTRTDILLPSPLASMAQRAGCLRTDSLLLWVAVALAITLLVLIAGGGLWMTAVVLFALAVVAIRVRSIGQSTSPGRPSVSPDIPPSEADASIGSAVASATPRRGWAPAEGNRTEPTAAVVRPTVSPADAVASIDAFRTAATAMLSALATPPAPGVEQHVLALDALARRAVAGVEPRTAVAAGLLSRLALVPSLPRVASDPIEPVMPYPTIDQPMYAPLARLGKEWLLPGFGSVPANSVSLLSTNQAFIEAYMAGLNHEMARELRYHEYPTDQRGTYFRQFWDVSTTVDATEETTYDITEMHTWTRGDLGDHSARPTPPDGEHLVLLVRGDLLRRYPNLIVTAIDAVDDDGRGQRTLGTTEVQPVFTGVLPPDAAFFGFALTPDQVTGADGGEGWFFVLQEQPAEPRFGLDIDGPARPASWDDLAWSQVDAAATYIDLDAEQPDTRSIAEPGGAAWHADTGLGDTGARASDIAYITLQRPYRVAIHASRMIEDEA